MKAEEGLVRRDRVKDSTCCLCSQLQAVKLRLRFLLSEMLAYKTQVLPTGNLQPDWKNERTAGTQNMEEVGPGGRET